MYKRILVLMFFSLLVSSAFCQQTERVKTFYSNGKLKETGKVVGSAKTGIWNYYREQGGLERKEHWTKGRMKWALLYNEQHQKAKMIRADGTEVVYKGCHCKS